MMSLCHYVTHSSFLGIFRGVGFQWIIELLLAFHGIVFVYGKS